MVALLGGFKADDIESELPFSETFSSSAIV